jgi:hypothetical protein
VLLHEFGEDFVLSLELVLQTGDEVVLGLLAGLGGTVGVEGAMGVFEELLLPAVEEGGGKSKLIAEVGDGGLLKEMAFEDGDLLLGRVVTTTLPHGRDLHWSYYTNSNEGFFHFRLRHNTES